MVVQVSMLVGKTLFGIARNAVGKPGSPRSKGQLKKLVRLGEAECIPVHRPRLFEDLDDQVSLSREKAQPSDFQKGMGRAKRNRLLVVFPEGGIVPRCDRQISSCLDRISLRQGLPRQV